MDIKEKIEELRAELHRHNYNYYVLNAPEISDKEFDDKMRELQDLEQAHPEYKDENSPTMRVGSDLNKNFTQVAHKYPMLSLANTYSEAEVTDFYDRVRKALNEDFEICCEMKYDGTSISLTYENGKLVRAVTRGFYFCTVSTHFSSGSVENSVENVKKCPHFVPFSLLSPVETSVLSTIYSKWALQKVYRPCSLLRIFSQMKTKRRSEKYRYLFHKNLRNLPVSYCIWRAILLQ